jgi:hypothetical protein
MVESAAGKVEYEVMGPTRQPLDAEATNRLVKHGAFLLKVFHREFTKDNTSRQTEFSRGEFAGWRATLRLLYGAAQADRITGAARKRASLPIPHCGEPTNDGYLGIDPGAEI